MGISRLFLRSIDKDSYWNELRLRRFAIFKKLVSNIESKDHIRIIDIGGTPVFWYNMRMADDSRYSIDCYNIKEFESRFNNISCFLGNATNLQNVNDGEYDIAFSNSVIEHLGTFENQQKMASEVRRVAKGYFVQTPNYSFPVEPHVRIPLIHFLPLSLITLFMLFRKQKSIRHYKRMRSAVKGIRLLSKSELRNLFPDGSMIEERFLGMVKSFIMYRM